MSTLRLRPSAHTPHVRTFSGLGVKSTLDSQMDLRIILVTAVWWPVYSAAYILPVIHQEVQILTE